MKNWSDVLIELQHNLGAVSYTHLDVYKRQVQNRTRMTRIGLIFADHFLIPDISIERKMIRT